MSTKKTTKKTAPVKKVATKKVVAKKTAAPGKRSSTSKKTVSKKTVSKKISSPKKSGKVLVCAKGKECFWTTDGEVIKDLAELKSALERMTATTFGHHVTTEKNDFADWVEHILVDNACATDLRKAKKPQTAKTVVIRHLRHYSI